MAISEVIEFRGSPDLLVWKCPQENFNTTSQLIVDETHEALLVLNGNAADLFGPGRHTLSTSNIPLANKIINIPTGGKTPFPCKVFYVNMVHQMDILWGTQEPIPLDDPLYDVFLHVMIRGSISLSVSDSRKFLVKLVGFRDSFDSKSLVGKFRGIIVSNVKDIISKVMINGHLSYFMLSANLMELSGVINEKLSEIFDNYGICVEFFNLEAIDIPDEDIAVVSEAKKLRSSRLIQGYSWQEEREMIIMEKFASNEGNIGMMGGVMGGAMGGMVMGNSISEIARNALGASSGERPPAPPKDPHGGPGGYTVPHPGAVPAGGFDVGGFFDRQSPSQSPAQPPVQPPVQQATDKKFCSNCGAELGPNAKFCSNCGTPVPTASKCPGCGNDIKPGDMFCSNCGLKLK